MEQLRDFLREALGKEPREDVAQYIENRNAVELLERGEDGEDAVLSMYLELERQFGDREPRTVIEIPPDSRTKTLSQILALEAARIEDVVRFRSQHLKGKLLEPGRVANWVDARASKSKTSKAPARKGTRENSRQGRRATEWLQYYDPASEKIQSAEIHPGSPLEDLKGIAVGLAELYQAWEEPHVVTFILDGQPPPIPLARIELKKNPLWPAASRAVLVVDPITLPQLPYRVLSEIKQEILPEGSKRIKPLSEKHLALSIVGEIKRGDPARPWDELMSEWNKRHPDWAYRSSSAVVQFSRDCRTGWSRVAGRAWPEK